MAAAQIVCRGVGPSATIALLVTVGYGDVVIQVGPPFQPLRVDTAAVPLGGLKTGVGAIRVTPSR